ncbi:MAG: RNA polymerase sigma factor [Saprospiraceae bacterium]
MNQEQNTILLAGITENNYTVLETIYQESLPKVQQYVLNNNGSSDDAQDVFQEAILVIYKKVKAQQLELTVDFHYYLFGICKRMWLNRLRRKDRTEAPLTAAQHFTTEENIEDNLIKTRKWNLFNTKFTQLADECRKVLQLFFNGESSRVIADQMGYSEEYAKRKKYKCKLSLAKLIKNDPEYRHLLLS